MQEGGSRREDVRKLDTDQLQEVNTGCRRGGQRSESEDKMLSNALGLVLATL